MGTITSSTGLVSGLNTSSIIDQLMAIEGQQKDLVQAKVNDATTQKTAYLDLTTRLTSLQISAQSVSNPSFFANATATSSDPTTITATASNGAAVGSYQFQVARLVQTQQLVSGGFSSANALVGAGTISLELGGGQLTQDNALSELRGGQGISRGQIRITDASGKSTLLDLSDAVDLSDVVDKINTSTDVSVKASIKDNKLVLTDTSGGTTGQLAVQDVGDTTTAADLGISGTATAGTITGTNDLQFVGRSTTLASLNDGNGVSNVVGADFALQLKNGTVANIDIGDATTVGGVIDAINKGTNNKVVASLKADGSGIQLVDTTTGGHAFAATNLGSSTAATDLGLTTAAAGNTISGGAVQAQLGTVLLKTLNGGAGLTLGTVNITDRAGVSKAVDLSGAASLQDVLDTINTSGSGVTASLNQAGNGIALADTTGGTGNIVVADTTGTGAAGLGIAGTFDQSHDTVQGTDLKRKWVSGSTTLASYAGGTGVNSGEFKITAADGTSKAIDVDTTTDLHLSDVITKINSSFDVNGVQKVTASINADGNGLLITDNTTGATKMSIVDDGGSTAEDLGILGTATTNTIDGTQKKTIDITATDTLADVQTKINNLGGGLSAAILNDGSGAAPFRLSLTAKNSGLAGQVTFDAGTTSLGTRTLVKAQDAAVFVGSPGGGQPLLVTASRNSISGVVQGLNLTLNAVSTAPVTVSVTGDVSNVTDALTTFVKNYNDLVTQIGIYTEFTPAASDPNATTAPASTDATNSSSTNSTTTTPPPGTKQVDVSGTTYNEGVLLGDYSVQEIQDQLGSLLQTVVPQAGKYNMLSSIGVSINQDGTLAFDSDAFNTAYSTDPDSVKTLFTDTSNSITATTKLQYLNGGLGIATAGDGINDFKASLADGTSFNVAVGTATTLNDVISSINAASGGKLRATLTDDKKVELDDLTTGTSKFSLLQQNGSQLLANLGLGTTSTTGKITSALLVSSDPLASATGGIGVNLQQKINHLIDPVDGLITTESSTLDDKITDYQNRITDLNTILDNKRAVLQDQFNNLETVLAKLQTQQSSLGSIKSAS